MKRFSCTGCGYAHKGDAPPDFCPICGAPESGFIEAKTEESDTARQKIERLSL